MEECWCCVYKKKKEKKEEKNKKRKRKTNNKFTIEETESERKSEKRVRLTSCKIQLVPSFMSAFDIKQTALVFIITVLVLLLDLLMFGKASL